MPGFFRKYKLQFEVFSILVLAVASVLFFIEYPEAVNKKMKLVSAIVFGFLAIAKTIDLVMFFRKKSAE